MHKVGLIGYGCWGKILHQKLKKIEVEIANELGNVTTK